MLTKKVRGGWDQLSIEEKQAFCQFILQQAVEYSNSAHLVRQLNNNKDNKNNKDNDGQDNKDNKDNDNKTSFLPIYITSRRIFSQSGIIKNNTKFYQNKNF